MSDPSRRHHIGEPKDAGPMNEYTTTAIENEQHSNSEDRPIRTLSPRATSAEYAPSDARAMSPRRDSAETEKLGRDARAAVHEQARLAQISLLEIAESIELVRSDHDKLEKQNLALQDYIGGLTRSMAKGVGGGKRKK